MLTSKGTKGCYYMSKHLYVKININSIKRTKIILLNVLLNIALFPCHFFKSLVFVCLSSNPQKLAEQQQQQQQQ